MKMTSKRLILMMGLIYALTVWPIAAEAATPARWQTYRSSVYGFAINLPPNMSRGSGTAAALPQKSVIPICGGTTVACFQYSGDEFNHTVIQGLGMAINVLRNKTTAAACDNIEFNVTKTTAIHGRSFYYAETGRASGGSSEGYTIYRTFYRHVCFEVDLATAQYDIPPAQYGAYGIKPVNRHALHEIQGEMQEMLESFTFVEPAKNGAAHGAYRESRNNNSLQQPSGSAARPVGPYEPEPGGIIGAPSPMGGSPGIATQPS